jgi:hypothetical protein
MKKGNSVKRMSHAPVTYRGKQASMPCIAGGKPNPPREAGGYITCNISQSFFGGIPPCFLGSLSSETNKGPAVKRPPGLVR